MTPHCDIPECYAAIVWECVCRRCASEPDRAERFHSCASKEHLTFVSTKHGRIRERGAEWLAIAPLALEDRRASARAAYQAGFRHGWEAAVGRCQEVIGGDRLTFGEIVGPPTVPPGDTGSDQK